ncbi:hypothetical protein HRG_003034 [Hirsutella rhossiliensis]|uniref:Uncharacterized protein n=1 Tax=Hirsutella rhossiliensis TaxID=111463 RepID=A0A9P8MZ02_9HYPO|nr:uncharacterized protein HRG_03034 [Hirsutella rhossiliensis]KAH0965018.1 hypothetical protein HRG_03034 [Hirsutella rhossiliensis]
MFDLPDAKRVRREDINESLGSGWLNSSDDEGIDGELHAQIGEALGLNLGILSPPSPSPKEIRAKNEAFNSRPSGDAQARGETVAEESQDEDLGEFEFRLFSTAGSKARVVLQSENEAQGEGSIVARRPSSYYLVPRLPTELRRQYKFAALSGEDVLARSQQRSWGLELPWKVTHITAAATASSPNAKSTSATGAVAESSESAGRKRPGKKTRIALRKRDRARKLTEEKQMDKEEHLKDKKKRLNRAKKLRRRAKDKEKKASADGGGAEGSESDDSE